MKDKLISLLEKYKEGTLSQDDIEFMTTEILDLMYFDAKRDKDKVKKLAERWLKAFSIPDEVLTDSPGESITVSKCMQSFYLYKINTNRE